MILNKVVPSKYDYVRDFARRGLERLGIDLLGASPRSRSSPTPRSARFAKTIKGSFINGKEQAPAGG